jgi:diadenylate cyclase
MSGVHLMAAESPSLTRLFLDYAVDLAVRIRARGILVSADVFQSNQSLSEFLTRNDQVQTVLLTRDAGAFDQVRQQGVEVIEVPGVRLTRMGQVKIAILLGLSRGMFKRGDELVCLTGVSGTGTLDTITTTAVGPEFDMVAAASVSELAAHVRPEVFERVLDIAIALGVEGREGKPLGAIFVVGDTENVLARSHQMVFNPFRGYPEEERQVLDRRLAETVKEFAAIDGAFVVQGDGVVVTAGAFLHVPVAGERLAGGLGARHNAAAAITAATKALAVTVSASTGTVTVFWGGKVLIEVERLQTVSAAPWFAFQEDD